MEPNRISFEEKERLTGLAAGLFKARHLDFYPCVANSDKLIALIESQLGMSVVQYPYPLQVENFEAAYDYILSSGGWFYERPAEVEVEDPEAVRESQAQQKVRDDFESRRQSEQLQRDRQMPLAELDKVVRRQNAQFREERQINNLPVRPTGLESRPFSATTLGSKATARANVALAHPTLDRNGAEFSKLYAAELARFSGK